MFGNKIWLPVSKTGSKSNKNFTLQAVKCFIKRFAVLC